MNEHPSELWMWGRHEALGTKQYWRVNYKVLRNGQWVFDSPYACGTEAFARQEAAVMTEKPFYKEVSVSGPHIAWGVIWWKERDWLREPVENSA